MNIKNIDKYEIAVVKSEDVLITDVQSALEFIVNVSYQSGFNKVIVDKSIILEDFFDLKTKLLGETFQKFVNYKIKMAIVGDFSVYKSKSMQAFIYEMNNGRDYFFVKTEKEAIEKLLNV